MTRGPHVGEHGLGGGRVEGEPRARLRVAADMGGGGVGGAGGGRVTSHAPTEASVLGLLLHSECEEKTFIKNREIILMCSRGEKYDIAC